MYIVIIKKVSSLRVTVTDEYVGSVTVNGKVRIFLRSALPRLELEIRSSIIPPGLKEILSTRNWLFRHQGKEQLSFCFPYYISTVISTASHNGHEESRTARAITPCPYTLSPALLEVFSPFNVFPVCPLQRMIQTKLQITHTVCADLCCIFSVTVSHIFGHNVNGDTFWSTEDCRTTNEEPIHTS